MTFDDMKERLKKEDEMTLLELLDLTSEELIDLLEEQIYDKQEEIRQFYGEDDTPLDW